MTSCQEAIALQRHSRILLSAKLTGSLFPPRARLPVEPRNDVASRIHDLHRHRGSESGLLRVRKMAGDPAMPVRAIAEDGGWSASKSLVAGLLQK